MEEQFHRMSEKALRQVLITSRAAWMMVCMSSRLLRQSCTWDTTSPSNCLQCCVWFKARTEGVLNRASHLMPLQVPFCKIKVRKKATKNCRFISAFVFVFPSLSVMTRSEGRRKILFLKKILKFSEISSQNFQTTSLQPDVLRWASSLGRGRSLAQRC